MIVPDAANMRSMLRSVWRPLAVLFAFDMLIAVLYVYGGQSWLSVRDIPLSIFGGAIGVIVDFRNTSSYQRWWEARTLWGAIVNYSRTFARQSLTMIIVPRDGSGEDRRRAEEIRQRLVLLQVAYVHSLRCQLRSQSAWQGLESFYSAQQMEIVRSQRNIPVFIQPEMSELLAECLKSGWLDSMRWTSIDQSLTALMNAQGGAERIKNTPMPRQYDLPSAAFCEALLFFAAVRNGGEPRHVHAGGIVACGLDFPGSSMKLAAILRIRSKTESTTYRCRRFRRLLKSI